MTDKIKNDSTENSADDIIIFSQLLQTAQSSGLPLPRGLVEISETIDDLKAAEWAKTIAKRMTEGRSLGESAADIPGMDKVLSMLISIPGGAGLSDVLTAYGRHLVVFRSIAEKMKTAVFYPFIVVWLAVIDLCVMNMMLFPTLEEAFSTKQVSFPIVMYLLYFFNFRTWPVSLIVPTLIFDIAILATKTLFFTPFARMHETFFGRILGLRKFAEIEEIGRFLGLLAIFLQAGQTLPQSIRLAARHSALTTNAANYCDLADAVENGATPADCFDKFGLLGEIVAGFHSLNRNDRLLEKIKSTSGNYLAAADRYREKVEIWGTIGGLLLVGFVVGILCIAFFSPYFKLVVSQ